MRRLHLDYQFARLGEDRSFRKEAQLEADLEAPTTGNLSLPKDDRDLLAELRRMLRDIGRAAEAKDIAFRFKEGGRPAGLSAASSFSLRQGLPAAHLRGGSCSTRKPAGLRSARRQAWKDEFRQRLKHRHRSRLSPPPVALLQPRSQVESWLPRPT